MSFFESLLGNAAITGQGMVGREIANQQSIEQDERRSAASLENSKSLADHNAELAQQKAIMMQELREKSEERSAAIYNKASDEAAPAGDERRFAKFKADLGQTDATEEQLRTVFKNQYNQRSVGNFGGADRYVDPESANQQDILGRLRANAAPATMVKSAQDDYKMQHNAERNRTIDALKERHQSGIEARDAMRYETDSARAQASLNASFAQIKRAEKSGDAAEKGAAVERLTTMLGEHRRIVADSAEELKMAELQGDATKVAEVKSRIAGSREIISTITAKQKENLSGAVDKPRGTAQSSIDHSSAIADGKRAIAQNPANREIVIKRLKEAGINTKGL